MYSICEYFAIYAKTQPNKIALVEKENKLTYQEMYTLMHGFCAYLKSKNIQKGDIVVCRASATVDYWTSFLGTLLSGGVFVPLEKDCSEEKLQAIMGSFNSVFGFISNEEDGKKPYNRALFIDMTSVVELAKQYADVDVEYAFPDYDEAATILFTTGTTGTAKGVIIPHKYFVESGLRTKDIPYGADTVILIPVPMNHVLGLGRVTATWTFGGTVVIIDGLSNLLDFYNALTIHRINAMAISPSGLNYLISLMGEELSEYSKDIMFMEIGGEKMPYQLQENLIKIFPTVRMYIGYASTETGMVCSYEFSKYGPTTKRIGRPIDKTEILTLGENGEPTYATKDNPGFFAVRSDAMMKGYFNNPAETEKVLKDNVITLSDYGYIDEEGFVCLLGRAGDVIISGGQKINPTEVEDCALKSGLFTECVCYGQSDELFGKVVKLLVVMKEGVAFDEFAIKKYLINTMEGFKLPKIIEEVDHVQRNKNGKIDRKFYSNQ